MLFSAMALALTSAQEKSPANESAAPSIGLEIGKEAPAFLARDQFDHEQTNETLKGPRGTVLLFFRSADW
jgi:hypothetical protein